MSGGTAHRLAAGLMLAAAGGCSPHAESGNRRSIDVNAAAARAQAEIANYADASHVGAAGAAVRDAPPPPARTASPSPAGPGGAPPTAAAPADDEAGSRQAAVALVRRYVDLLAAGHYRAAWLLWADDGKASGMSAEAFARSFARYRSFAAEVGGPYGADAGAGQRYISVPVTVTGTLVRGGDYRLAGPLVLHRVAGGIETPSPADHQWRIQDSQLKPRPDDAAAPTGLPRGEPATAAAHYGCRGGERFDVAFDNRADTATVTMPGKPPVVLKGQRPASGIWYAAGGWDLRGKGRIATLNRPGARPADCSAAE